MIETKKGKKSPTTGVTYLIINCSKKTARYKILDTDTDDDYKLKFFMGLGIKKKGGDNEEEGIA